MVTAYIEKVKKYMEQYGLEDKVQEFDVSSATVERMLEDWSSRLLNLSLDGNIVGILHTVNDNIADTVKNEGTQVLFGQDYFYEELLGMKFKITPFSFFQTNSLGAEVLYKKARDYIGDTKDKVIFDLYSGTGTIAQILAPVAKRVVGVEIVEEAVEAAKENGGTDNIGVVLIEPFADEVSVL